jgi:hypothetical protein
MTKIKDNLKATNDFQPNLSLFDQNETSLFGSIKLSEYCSNKKSFKSEILKGEQQSVELIELCEFSPNDKWSLLYRATKSGFSSRDFHSKCDGIQGTLSVVKTINQSSSFIFGGYTQADWNGGYGINKYDANAFIFSLTNSYNVSVKMNVTDPANAIYAGPNYLINFGSFEFYIYDGGRGFSDGLGKNYQLPSSYYLDLHYTHPK